MRRALQFQKISRGRYHPKPIREGAPLAALPQSADEHRGPLRTPTDTDCVRACNHLSEINVSWFCCRASLASHYLLMMSFAD